MRTKLKGMRLYQEASKSWTLWQISSNRERARGNSQKQLQTSSLVIFKEDAAYGVCVYVLYVLTRYTHKYLIYKK